MGILSPNIFFAGAGNASTFPFWAIVCLEVLGLSNMTYAVVMAINAFARADVALGWLSDKIDDGSSFFVPSQEHSVLDLCGPDRVHLHSTPDFD